MPTGLSPWPKAAFILMLPLLSHKLPAGGSTRWEGFALGVGRIYPKRIKQLSRFRISWNYREMLLRPHFTLHKKINKPCKCKSVLSIEKSKRFSKFNSFHFVSCIPTKRTQKLFQRKRFRLESYFKAIMLFLILEAPNKDATVGSV